MSVLTDSTRDASRGQNGAFPDRSCRFSVARSALGCSLRLLTNCANSAPALIFRESSETFTAIVRHASVEWIVRDGSNRAVANATVTVHNSNGSKRSVSTDVNGFYDKSADVNQNYVVPWLFMEVSKPGYEDTRNGALASNQDTNRDLYLFELARLTAGSDAQLSATFEGPLCGFDLNIHAAACRSSRRRVGRLQSNRSRRIRQVHLCLVP